MLQSGLKSEQWNHLLHSMTYSLAHRGPDDAGLCMMLMYPWGRFCRVVLIPPVCGVNAAQSTHRVRAFSIRFYEQRYYEAEYAQAVARHLETDHIELYVTPEQAMAVIPKLPTLYDEPFSDSSQTPMFLISELARQYVTVSLSGDGGDELFCGYTRYYIGQYRFGLRGKIEGLSPLGRRVLARMLSGVHTKIFDGKLRSLVSLLRKYGLVGAVGSKLNMMAETLVDHPHAIFLELVSHWENPAFLVLGAKDPPTPVTLKGGLI